MAYFGKLVGFIKHGWLIPDSIEDSERLRATASLEILSSGRIGASKIEESSGHPIFDLSVEHVFGELRARGATIPEPPADLRDEILGKTISIRFYGRRPTARR